MEFPADLDYDEVVAIVEDVDVEVDVELDLLDVDGTVLDDLTDVLAPAGSDVSHDLDVDVSGSCRLVLATTLDWSAVRLRPKMRLTSPAGSFVRDLGVYRPLRPARTTGEDVTVVGLDLTSTLAYPHGETVTIDVDEKYVDVAVAVAASRGVTLEVAAAGESKVAPRPRWWSIETPTLESVGDLLAEGGFRRPWADHTSGVLRSGPETPVADRPTEWVYDADHDRTTVGPSRTLDEGDGDVPNRLVAVTNSPLSWAAVEGDGQVTLDAVGDQQRTGTVRPEVVRLDATDQEVLETLAAAEFATLRRQETEVRMQVAPNPCHWHGDVVRVRDGDLELDLRGVVTSWQLPFDASDMALTVRRAA